MKKIVTMGILMFLILIISGCSSAGDSYNNGKKSYEEGNYDRAADYFSAAILENPNRAEYYIDYGMTLIKLGKYEEALLQFDKAYVDKDILIVKQNNKRVHRGKGIAYCYQLNYEDAVAEFRNALEIDELSYLDEDILNYMGNALMITGSYQEALNTYSLLLTLNVKDVDAYINRALCYRYLGDYEKSLADYDKAISLQPDEYTAYFGKYYLMEDSGNPTGAAEVLVLVSQIKAVTSEDKYNLAKIHYYQDDYETALTELNEAYTNGFTEAYYYIGEIYRIEKDYQKAIYYYESMVNEGEYLTPSLYNQLASCMIKTEDYRTAIKYLELGIAYQDAGAMKTLKKNEIIAYEGLGDFSTAMKKMEEYLVAYPDDEEALKESEFINTRLLDINTDIEQTNE